jgi:ribonuclease M5
MMRLGLSGGTDSSAKRKALMKLLKLPEQMSANAFLQAVNLLCTREEFLSLTEKLEQNDG